MSIENILVGIFSFLGKGTIIFAAYYLGRTLPEQFTKPKWLNYFRILGATTLISFIMWSSYGTHIENSDPLYGGGEIVSDFEPSQQEKNEYGLIIFFSLLIPALFGVIGAKTKEDKIKEEVDHIRQLNGQIALQKEQKIKKK